MIASLDRAGLRTLARGFTWLGSGGGGSTRNLELVLSHQDVWPVRIHDLHALDPGTACVAVAYAGSTYLMTERLPGTHLFEPLIRAAERWTGARAGAVCSMEGAAMNGLAPLLLASRLPLVDADLSGRAIPRLDQMSMMIDSVPGLVAVADTGAGGVVVIDSPRPADIEGMVRAALVQAGGVGAILLAGFTLEDLTEHAILGGYARAHRLGAVRTEGRPATHIAAEVGGRLLATGPVEDVAAGVTDAYSSSVLLTDAAGASIRVVGCTEFLAVQKDGATVAASPDIIVVLDTATGELVEISEVQVSRHVAVIALAPDPWWDKEARWRRVSPEAFGIHGLDTGGRGHHGN